MEQTSCIIGYRIRIVKTIICLEHNAGFGGVADDEAQIRILGMGQIARPILVRLDAVVDHIDKSGLHALCATNDVGVKAVLLF